MEKPEIIQEERKMTNGEACDGWIGQLPCNARKAGRATGESAFAWERRKRMERNVNSSEARTGGRGVPLKRRKVLAAASVRYP